jgi:signal transduction histidine kinase
LHLNITVHGPVGNTFQHSPQLRCEDFDMSSDASSKATYHGRILNGDFSPELKEKLRKVIPVFHAFDQTGSPAIPYISAWQGNKKNIWYEFVSRKFLALLDCGPTNIADILRSAIVDRRIYKSRFVDPLDATEVTSREELNEARGSLREESEKKGLIEAVYKLKLSSHNSLWLKDQAMIMTYPEDDTSLSFGCLTIVTTEMEVEEERQRLISEKSRLENQLQKIHHFEAIGNLAEGIALDLNQKILGIEKNIAATIESLGNDYHGDASAFQDYQNLKTAEQQIKDIKHISSQLLNFAGKGIYNYYETDLNEITLYALQEFRLMEPEVELTTQCQDNLWRVNADRAMIGRALLNICRHAAQSEPGTRELEIESRNITLSPQFVEPYGRDPGDYVLVRVTNRAAVLDEKDAGQVLEPFRSADKGLRMASAFGIIKKHSGVMTVSSDAEKGSVFSIYLPALKLPAASDGESPTVRNSV